MGTLGRTNLRRIEGKVKNAHFGFSEELLEELCARPRRNKLGLAPWVTWESENSSFGKTFRVWARFPRWLPLFVVSDHGVHWESRCWENEVNSNLPNFFTWNYKKSLKMQVEFKGKSHHVPHPWVFYRRKFIGDPPPVRSGTIVFFPHSNSTTSPRFEDFEGYMSGLKSLPSRFQPIVICLMSHDVEKGLHKKLASFGLPIVSAGNSSSTDFVDYFYKILFQFKFATSPASTPVGSHVYYALEAGIPFFLFGEGVNYYIENSISTKDGVLNLLEYGDSEDIERMIGLKALLASPLEAVSEEQALKVYEYLGLSSSFSRRSACRILWKSLGGNWNEGLKLYIRDLKNILIR